MSIIFPFQRATLLLLAFVASLSACQMTKVRKRTADERIVDLQQGVLLVRLQTGERQAEVLRSTGKPAEAEKLLQDRRAFNDQIRAAFAEHYDFSPVFFFLAPDSKLVRERAFDHILSDHAGRAVAADEITGKPFLAAEFGEVQSPAPMAGLDALYLMDDQLRQLDQPFPYAVPTHLFPEEELVDRSVARLNLKLRAFAAKASYRVQRRQLRDMRKGIR